MKKIKKNKKSNYIIYICLAVIIVFVLVLAISNYMISSKKFDVSDLIVNNSYDVVYDLNEIPVINLSGDIFTKINSEIRDYYALNSNNDRFEYEYNVSEDTLSILLTRYVVVENKEYLEYKSYNIDLINMKNLSYDETLDKFNITIDDLSFFMKNKFLNYYADLIEEGYIEGNKCDFNCFLVNCNFQDLDEDNVLYIKKNHLYLYKFFDIYNDYGYSDYFSYNDFIFEVK